MARYRRILLFHNRASGSGLPDAVWEDVSSRLRNSSDLLEEVAVEPQLNIGQRVAEALGAGADLVIAAGGDGTVREVASALVGSGKMLGIIPIGTFNNLALSLGVPRDPMMACELIETGTARGIDVGIADDRNFFFEAAGVGVDADLFPIGEEVKRGRFLGVLRAIRLALLHKQTSLLLRFDRPINAAYRESIQGKSAIKRRRRFRGVQTQVAIRCSFVVIGIGPYYGSNFEVCPGALLDDGLLTVGVYRDFSKSELIRHFWSISRGRRQYHPKLEMFDAGMIEIIPRKPLSVHIDGNPIGTTPVRFTIKPGALDVIAPGGGAGK
jgi:diacylglycerol kinase (ATP)